jgi:HD-GYP domain-containing protein (c-di-GMP phosphodiesterase class II)
MNRTVRLADYGYGVTPSSSVSTADFVSSERIKEHATVPLLTNTNDLTPQSRLHQPVYDGEQLLLPAGKVLNSADVDFLRRRCPGGEVYIEDPVLDRLVSFDDIGRDNEVARTAQRRLVELVGEVRDKCASTMDVSSLDCPAIDRAVQGVLGFLEENPVMALRLSAPSQGEHYLTSHAAHVFYLSLVLGNDVRARVNEARRLDPGKYSPITQRDFNIAPLAIAALFMDLGMWPIKELFEQDEPLTLEQCERIRNHPVESARALPPDAPELTRLVVETHHENFDGTGYPYGLRGDEIHIFARVLRIADAFAAATAQQIYQQACSPVRALWEMTWGPFTHFYDPILLKVFATRLQPYPIGAKVKLNTGHYGVVVRHNADSPFLPEIIVALDENGAPLRKEQLVGPISLRERGDFRIVSFQGEDLSDLYDRDTIIPEVSASEFTTLYDGVYTGRATSHAR